ncbi:MAG: ribonuclease R [Alphaproteobacteria bacterium]
MPPRPPKQKRSPLPTKEELLGYIRESPVPVGKREIARAFRLSGAERIQLKTMLKELQQEGTLGRERGRRFGAPGRLPEVTLVEIAGTDADGELLARPLAWEGETPPPRIYMAPERRGTPALGAGERVLARLRHVGGGSYEGRVIRRVSEAPGKVLGVFALGPDGGRIRPTERKDKAEYGVARGDEGGAREGELVLAEALPGHHRLGLRHARVVERLGEMGNPRSISLIAILGRGIPVDFPADALAAAAAAGPVGLAGRTDLRRTPLVTIDGEDARDFDDAVWAEPDPDPGNPDGWHLLVAIADVAHYVRPASALDRAASERGNSAYFPDRVVPMLPEALSNGWCSLKPGEERGCLAVHMWIDKAGNKLRHRFERGLMRSAARLTYGRVQAARDGQADELTGPLVELVIAPLYGAFHALLAARLKRGALDLDLPERQVVIGEDGRIERIIPRARLDSHRLIEEFMIAANVSAAETLEQKKTLCMYRVHDEPAAEKIEALRDFLATLGYKLAKGQVLSPRHFTQILEKAASTPHSQLVSEVILRSQAQAVYGPDNRGHFGLALRRYAHFTSPIRRYGDLLVHRGLIASLGLGPDGLSAGATQAHFARLGEHISMTERRADAAERDAEDRFIAAYLAAKVGASFAGRISGVTRFGLFVTLEETGADGLVPISTLPSDYYIHEEARHRLVGRASGVAFVLGDKVEVRLAEADMVTGGLIFELLVETGRGRPAKGRGRPFRARGGSPRGGKTKARRSYP